MCGKRYHIIFSTFFLKFKCKICVQKEVIYNFKNHILVWKTKSLLFFLRYVPLMILRWQNHINFICIKNDVTWLFNENGLLPSSPGTFQGKSMERPVSVFDTNRISIEISNKRKWTWYLQSNEQPKRLKKYLKIRLDRESSPGLCDDRETLNPLASSAQSVWLAQWIAERYFLNCVPKITYLCSKLGNNETHTSKYTIMNLLYRRNRSAVL